MQNGQPLSNPFKEPNCPEYIMPIQQQAADILFNRSRSVLYLWTLLFTKTKNIMPQQFQILCKLVRLCHLFNCKSFVVLLTIGVFECFFLETHLVLKKFWNKANRAQANKIFLHRKFLKILRTVHPHSKKVLTSQKFFPKILIF